MTFQLIYASANWIILCNCRTHLFLTQLNCYRLHHVEKTNFTSELFIESAALWCSFTQTESLVARLALPTWKINYFDVQSVFELAMTSDAVVGLLTFMRAGWKLTHWRWLCGLKIPSGAITAHPLLSAAWGACHIADGKIRPSIPTTFDFISPVMTCSTRFSFSFSISRIEFCRRLHAR